MATEHPAYPDTVAQVIPVLMVAVAIEGGGSLLPVLPRRFGTGWRVPYWLILGLYATLLLGGELLAIIQPDEWCSSLVDGIQIAAITAGLFTVVFGIGFSTIGAVLAIQAKWLKTQEDYFYFEVGVSNEYRARKIDPLLNLLVPAGVEIREVGRDLTVIDGVSILPTTETIKGFSVTKWDHLNREFGVTAGDNRVGYFRLSRTPKYTETAVPVVIRLDHQDLRGNRNQIEKIPTW